MPKVEQYGGARVATNASRQPKANAASGNSVFNSNAQGIASSNRSNQQLINTTQQLAQAGANMVQRIDTTAAEEALVSFERDKNDIFFNPDKGYFNTQGKNAYDGAELANKALEDIKAKYGENLSSNARSMFEKSASIQISRSKMDINRHASTGLKAWEVATINAQTENTLENASLYWNDEQRLGVQNAVGRQSVIDSAELEGIGLEATNERLQTYDSTFMSTAVGRAIDSGSSTGKNYMDKYGSRLEGPDKVKLQKKLDSKIKAEHTQLVSQSAINNGTKLVRDYETRSEIMEQVNAIEDPEVRKKTMTESMRLFNLKKQAENELQTGSFESAELHVAEGGSAETFQANDPEGWDRLSTKQKKSLEAGKQISTNWNTYSSLMLLPKEELAKVVPSEHFTELAESERKSLVTAVKGASGKSSPKEKVDSQIGRTRTAQTTSALELVLGKKNKWNEDKRKQADSFYDLLDSEVKYREQQKDGQLSSQEFTDVLSDLTREVTIEKSAFGIGFLYPDEEQSVTDIPPENVRLLSQFLRDKGIPVTADNLLKAQRQASK